MNLQTKRLKDVLAEISPELGELIDSGKIKIETLAIKEGFINREEKVLILN